MTNVIQVLCEKAFGVRTSVDSARFVKRKRNIFTSQVNAMYTTFIGRVEEKTLYRISPTNQQALALHCNFYDLTIVYLQCQEQFHSCYQSSHNKITGW